MSELQATVEFSIELHKFYNVDLFQRGFYQIRTSLKVSPKIPVKIEVNLDRNQKSEHMFSPFIANGCGVSRIFQILYRNQEVLLDNIILFRVHLLVDSFKIEETLERADFTLNVELWFTEQPYLLSQQNGTCVSLRTLYFHFSPIKGLHYHLPVLFDYFHLAAVTITIHAILVALHQPYINTPRSTKTFFGTSTHLHTNQTSSVDALLFGSAHSTKCVSTGARLTHAKYVHQEVCSILLTTYDTLQSHLHDYMKLLPTWQQLKLETNDCLKRLNSLNDAAKLIETEDDFISMANSDIAQLCAENILLWQQFLDAFTSKTPILQHLAKCHHQLRVKRFSEAFFVVDNPRQSAAGCYDANYQNYVNVSETVRRSRYLSSLPSLPVTCMELDGDISTMPIIFEDQYKDVLNFARRRNHASKKSGSDSVLSVNIPLHSLKEECSCGIVAILESRSQKISSHSSTTSQQNFYSLNTLRPNSTGIVKEVKGNKYEKGKTEISSSNNAEIKKNISNLSLIEKGKINVKAEGVTLGGSSYKTLPNPRQRHSKSLDQLKNTKAYFCQVPAALNSITRSISSQMPYNTQRSIINEFKLENSNFKISSFSKTEKESIFSPSSDSYDSEGSDKHLGSSLIAPYNLCENSLNKNNDIYLSGKIKHSESTLSMPNTSLAFIETLKNHDRFLEENSSESMPNLIQTPNDSPKNFDRLLPKFNCRKTPDTKDILALYKINGSTIFEEATDDHCTVFEVNIPKDAVLSSPSASMSDEITSEQSGWVSNSSHHSSESQISSGAPSPKTTILKRRNPKILDKTVSLPVDSFFSSDILIKKLEKLALNSEQPPPSNDQVEEDVRLPPPHQFRDVPSPPEHFRDSPAPRVPNNSKMHISNDSIDAYDILHRIYDFDVEKKAMKKKKDFRVSLQNLTLDFFKETKMRNRNTRRRSKKQEKEKKLRMTSDEGFDDVEERCNESDTGMTVEFSRQKKLKTKAADKILNPFHGYVFKEDVEILKKNHETKETKNLTPNRKVERRLFKNNTINHEEAKDEVNSCREKKYKLKIINLEDEKLKFIKAKEEFKRQMNFTGMLYSDFPTLASTLPYFHISDEYRIFSPEGLHLIICVHGLDGNSNDLRLVKTYVELGLPGANLEFLMSERNQGDTFSDFETMTDKLVAEILHHIETCGPMPSKISFIGHSLGNIIIRSAITRPQLKHLLPRFHTFLSLSGPHLGTLYNNSGLVNMGMWFMQKWKKSGSLLQLSLKDAPDVRQTFLYRLSQKSNLHCFRHVLLCGSSQDRYVPMHSARIELCKAAIKDTTIQGVVYKEMVHNIINPVINSSETTLVRYDIHHALPNTANSLIGRAAHIAVLDSELFIEKFLVVTGLKYFR